MLVRFLILLLFLVSCLPGQQAQEDKLDFDDLDGNSDIIEESVDGEEEEEETATIDELFLDFKEAVFRPSNLCLNCHSVAVPGPRFDHLTSQRQWLNSKFVKAGNPAGSPIHVRLRQTGSDVAPRNMPFNSDIIVSSEDQDAIRDWIFRVKPADFNLGEGTLVELGILKTVEPFELSDRFYEYEVNAPLFSGKVKKRRFIYIPEDSETKIQIVNGEWQFPDGTIIVKHFYTDTKKLETRVIITGREWSFKSYKWNEDDSDAYSFKEDIEENLFIKGEEHRWLYPAASSCITCHSQNKSLGLTSYQLNKDIVDEDGNSTNQLDGMKHLGILENFDQVEYSKEFLYPYIEEGTIGSQSTLRRRARAFTHVNCSSCHNPQGIQPNMNLLYENDYEGVIGSRILEGDVNNSFLWIKMNLVHNQGGMSPYKPLNNVEGIELMEEFIESLEVQPEDEVIFE